MPDSLHLTQDLSFAMSKGELRRDGQVVGLTGQELAVLAALANAAATHKGEPALASYVTTKDLAEQVLGTQRPNDGHDTDELRRHRIEQTVFELRCKLGSQDLGRRLLRNWRGHGYALIPEP